MKERLGREDLRRLEVMQEILKSVSEKPLIFKGGSALMFFYGLDRFSEDLDFDSKYEISVKSLMSTFKRIGEIAVKKDTKTVKRIYVKPSGENFNIKVEISLRSYTPIDEPISVFNKLKVYSINDLFSQKIKAFIGRDKARDLYDIGFIVWKYGERLNKNLKTKFFQVFSSPEEIYDLIPQQVDLFKADRLLTDSDLLEATRRIMNFYERELQKNLRKGNNFSIEP
jgi:predicted nucleotidyltransferase component of viral defense system